ncbi:MAG: prepilin-type N-terminal cleavage/methylation domain-containing protein [Luteibacter sp.]
MSAVTGRKGEASGFSLIELMVTLTVLAFLILLSAPLTRAWVQSAHQRSAYGMLLEALGRAKALSLRNAAAQTDQTLPVAAACLIGSDARVVVPVGTSLSCAAGIVWSSTLPEDAEVTLATGGGALSCVAYNERGLALDATVGGLHCTPAPNNGQQAIINVIVGNENALTVSIP